jgi:hypothetical protein
MRVRTRLLLELVQSTRIVQKPDARQATGGVGDGLIWQRCLLPYETSPPMLQSSSLPCPA